MHYGPVLTLVNTVIDIIAKNALPRFGSGVLLRSLLQILGPVVLTGLLSAGTDLNDVGDLAGRRIQSALGK